LRIGEAVFAGLLRAMRVGKKEEVLLFLSLSSLTSLGTQSPSASAPPAAAASASTSVGSIALLLILLAWRCEREREEGPCSFRGVLKERQLTGFFFFVRGAERPEEVLDVLDRREFFCRLRPKAFGEGGGLSCARAT
jgi:hypothetical protein